jgi:hypothetical protein
VPVRQRFLNSLWKCLSSSDFHENTELIRPRFLLSSHFSGL